MASTCSSDSWSKLLETRQRLERCWSLDIDWDLYPTTFKNVRNSYMHAWIIDKYRVDSLTGPFGIFNMLEKKLEHNKGIFMGS